MVIYGRTEVASILRCSRSKAYEVIRTLKTELEAKGLLTPCQGKIQARFFCERFGLDLDECQSILQNTVSK